MARRPPPLLVKVVTALALVLYRVSGGRIGGKFGNLSVLLLATRGRKTGKKRTVPLGYFEDEGRIVVIASFGGSDVHPAWYLNLAANPEVEMRIGGARGRPMRARTATPEERDAVWPKVAKLWPGYRRYQEKTEREIPLVILEPRPAE